MDSHNAINFDRGCQGEASDIPRPYLLGIRLRLGLVLVGLLFLLLLVGVDSVEASPYTGICQARAATRPSMPLVAAITPIEFGDPVDPIRFSKSVYSEIVKQGIPPDGAQLLTAHMALSTGWGKAVHNYVFAGIKAKGGVALCYGNAPDPGYPYICKCSWERRKTGQWAEGCPDRCAPKRGIPRCPYPFRAYRNLGEGVRAVIQALRQSRYAKSWSYLMDGDTDYFYQLGIDGWYTAEPTSTAKSMRTYLAKVRKYLGMPDPPPIARFGPILFVGGGIALAWYVSKKGWI